VLGKLKVLTYLTHPHAKSVWSDTCLGTNSC